MIGELGEDGWVRVEWTNGTTNSYRMGKEGKYDLTLASPPSPVTSDTDTEEVSEGSSNCGKENQLITLLRDASVNFLRNISISSGLAGNTLQPSTIRGISSLFCNMLNTANQDWCNLTLTKSIVRSNDMCMAFSSRPWVNMLLDFVSGNINAGGNIVNLPKQILSTRLLQTVLQSWDLDNPDIPTVVERLLNVLGKIALTCLYDIGNKPLCETKSLVLLTQSHSSTLAQEIVNLLRTLHGLVGWNQMLNSIIINKVNAAAYLLSEQCLIPSLTDSITTEYHFMVAACLYMIGAWDSRPRVGAVVEIESVLGTVVRVTQKGKLCVQLHETKEIKKVSLSNLKLIPMQMFNLDRIPFSENLVKTWGLLLLNKQNFWNQERKSNYGQINPYYLRNQQIMLYTLNATRILYTNQHKLRKVLKYQINNLDQSQDLSNMNEEESQSCFLLIQKLLIKAIQPSPLKPLFNLQDMQLACLNLNQYLAAEDNIDKPNVTANNDKSVKVAEANSELPTPSECSVKSVVSEKSNKKRKNDESNNLPINKMISQIVEMGFTKKRVENTMKSLGLATETMLTPEIIVSWLVDHPEITSDDTESVSSYYSSDDSESPSEQIDIALHAIGDYVRFAIYFV